MLSSFIASLGDWLTKRWEIAKGMLINYNGFHLLITQMAKCMWKWLSGQPLKLLTSTVLLPLLIQITNCNPFWFCALNMFSLVVICWQLLQPALILLLGKCNVGSFSLCADPCHRLQHNYMQHVMYEYNF